MNRVFLIVVLMLCGWATAGCAIHYFDPTTGTEHLWGFGHMKMKVAAPNEGLQALVRETQTLGLAVGSLEAQSYLSLGIQRKRRLEVIDENTAIRFEWPNSDFFSVRVGSEFPTIFSPRQADKATNQEQETKQ